VLVAITKDSQKEGYDYFYRGFANVPFYDDNGREKHPDVKEKLYTYIRDNPNTEGLDVYIVALIPEVPKMENVMDEWIRSRLSKERTPSENIHSETTKQQLPNVVTSSTSDCNLTQQTLKVHLNECGCYSYQLVDVCVESTGGGGSGSFGGGNPSQNMCVIDCDNNFTEPTINTQIMTGDIIITEEFADNPKLNCVFEKLNDTGTFRSLIGEFAGESTHFDLKFDVGNLGNTTLGILDDDNPEDSTLFRIVIDRENLDRLPIEIAVTLLHEAMHAEMRRFLHAYQAENSTSLPGFPGDITSDWKLFVELSFDGDNPFEQAEHEVMAARYIPIIVKGLKAFDNNNLTDDEYTALAWQGLSFSKIYQNLPGDDKTKVVENTKTAKSKSAKTCN